MLKSNTVLKFLVKFQVSWTSKTSHSDSLPANYVSAWFTWDFNVSTGTITISSTSVWASKGRGWFPFLWGDTVIVSAVQTLIATLTEFQGKREASLTVSQSTDTLDKVVSVVADFIITVIFSVA